MDWFFRLSFLVAEAWAGIEFVHILEENHRNPKGFQTFQHTSPNSANLWCSNFCIWSSHNWASLSVSRPLATHRWVGWFLVVFEHPNHQTPLVSHSFTPRPISHSFTPRPMVSCWGSISKSATSLMPRCQHLAQHQALHQKRWWWLWPISGNPGSHGQGQRSGLLDLCWFSCEILQMLLFRDYKPYCAHTGPSR